VSETTDLPPLTDPVEILRLLHAGDRLAHCHPIGWRLLSGDVAVSETAVNALKRGVTRIAGNGCPDSGGGRLVPLDDGLFGGFSQTWMWAEGGTAVPP